MAKGESLVRARTLIEIEGDPVIYRGVKWYFLRRPMAWTRRALKLLDKEKKLVRWSEKTKYLVRIVD